MRESSTIGPPIRITAIIVPFMKSVMTGDMKIITFAALIPACFNSRLAAWNFSFSKSSRTKLFTTRTFVTFS